MKSRILTGLQPSGVLHIGNYFGALKPMVELSREHDALVAVVDYHALTSLKDGEKLRSYIFEAARDILAAGIDPEKSILFQQSQVPQHTELAWIFDCLVTTSFLELSHAYKDKVAKGLEPNAGLFTYPMLMAADILLYDTDIVPVGADQRQHVEYAREAAAKFNHAFGVAFKEPKDQILEAVAVLPGVDGRKMSKSYGNTIPLFGSKDQIAKAVMSIVTDSGGDRPENVFAIHRHFRSEGDLSKLYEERRGKYKALKDQLVDDIESLVAPMREKRDSFSDDDVRRILADGSDKAREQAEAKMKQVRSLVGVTI